MRRRWPPLRPPERSRQAWEQRPAVGCRGLAPQQPHFHQSLCLACRFPARRRPCRPWVTRLRQLTSQMPIESYVGVRVREIVAFLEDKGANFPETV